VRKTAEMLDWCRSRYAETRRSRRPAAELAKTYLPANRACRVTVIPAPKSAAAAAPAAAKQ